jgi:hypothetical protein
MEVDGGVSKLVGIPSTPWGVRFLVEMKATRSSIVTQRTFPHGIITQFVPIGEVEWNIPLPTRCIGHPVWRIEDLEYLEEHVLRIR